MAEEQGGASFNPDDASGLLDNARVKVASVVVDYVVAKSGKNAGQKYVTAAFTFEGGGQKVTESYMIGDETQWAPNATKTGVLPINGATIWNKSNIFKLCKSFIDSSFPKAQVGKDLSVFVGTDCHVNRVTEDGQTYTDKDGKERTRTILLVTKIYELPKAGGVKTTAMGAKVSKTPPTTAPAGAGAADDSNDVLLTDWLVEILANGAVTRDGLLQPVFIRASRAKLAAKRQALQDRIQSEAFLGGLAEAGLITVDGASIALAG